MLVNEGHSVERGAEDNRMGRIKRWAGLVYWGCISVSAFPAVDSLATSVPLLRVRLFNSPRSSARVPNMSNTRSNTVTKIFVGNLNFQTTQDDLTAAFAPYGAIE